MIDNFKDVYSVMKDLPIQIILVGIKHLPRLGDMPYLNHTSASTQFPPICAHAMTHLRVLILDFRRRQELDGFPLKKHL